MSLVIGRNENETLDIINRKTGDIIKLKFYQIRIGKLRISCLDDNDLFEIQRPERSKRIMEQRNS